MLRSEKDQNSQMIPISISSKMLFQRTQTLWLEYLWDIESIGSIISLSHVFKAETNHRDTNTESHKCGVCSCVSWIRYMAAANGKYRLKAIMVQNASVQTCGGDGVFTIQYRVCIHSSLSMKSNLSCDKHKSPCRVSNIFDRDSNGGV